jgi:hypothetical protein
MVVRTGNVVTVGLGPMLVGGPLVGTVTIDVGGVDLVFGHEVLPGGGVAKGRRSPTTWVVPPVVLCPSTIR